MIAWIFNFSIISILVILIFHYALDFFPQNKSIENLVDLKVQKYKNIIDTTNMDEKKKAINTSQSPKIK